MSEEQPNQVSDQDVMQDVPANDYVPKKAFEDVTKDMHRFKSELKSAKAAKSEYEARLKALEEEKMRENEQWKELSEKYKQEVEIERQKREHERSAYLDTVKKSALKNELGGSIKDIYLSHANIDGIEVNEDGLIDRDSLLNVANEFRKEHGVLLGSISGVSSTSSAPSNQPLSNGQKDLSEMTYEEKAEMLKKFKLSKI